MLKKSRIDEILSKKHSLDDEHIYIRLKAISDLEVMYKEVLDESFAEDDNTINKLNENMHALHEAILYPAVGLVSCIESFFRGKVKALVDSSPFYKKNAAKLQVKLDLATAIDLEVNNLSIGEFVAHIVKLNNINDINSTISELLGEDFMKAMAMWREKLDTQRDLFENTNLELSASQKFGWLMKNLDELYMVRNKVCHESNILISVNFRAEYLYFSKHVIEFVSVADEMINHHIKEKGSVSLILD